MEESYVSNFGIKPKKDIGPVNLWLEKGDHPELNVSAFLNDEDTQIYQSLVGSLQQWAVTHGRFDVNTAVMSMSSFCAQLRQGHLNRLSRIIAYPCKYRHFKICSCTEEPDFLWLKDNKQNWSNPVYGKPTEDKPKDAPKPLSKLVHLISYFDANLMHDVLSGKAVTGILHFSNKTPVAWYCKKQNLSECATYSAKYLSYRTCIKQIVDLGNTLRYLGLNLQDKCYVSGDNKSMINSSTVPYARLHKQNNILSYHYVRSTLAAGYINLIHIPSQSNTIDIVSKYWGYQSVWKNILQPIFHWSGYTKIYMKTVIWIILRLL